MLRIALYSAGSLAVVYSMLILGIAIKAGIAEKPLTGSPTTTIALAVVGGVVLFVGLLTIRMGFAAGRKNNPV